MMWNIEFRDPAFFLLLPLVLFVFWLCRRSHSALTFSSASLFSATGKSWRQRLSIVPAILFSLSTTLVIVALARPRTPESETKISTDGIAIMMVVDLSSSMNARDLVEDDLSINRLDVVKEVFTDFVLGSDESSVDGRPSDLVGLVTFAGYADSVCPLTLDHGNLASLVKELEIVSSRTEDGTSVGDGLGLAVERLRRSKAKSRIAILLTDGVNNAGVLPPEKAAQLAKEQDIRVYCIGAGTNGMAPIPTRSPFGQLTLIGAPVEIDEKTLKNIAQVTGGKYFRATNREGLGEVYQAIDRLEKTEISQLQYLRYHEHFTQVLAPAFLLLVLAALLAGSVFRQLP